MTATLEQKYQQLLIAARRLAWLSNRITAEHRHHQTIGKTFGDEELVKLYDAQILVEELTGSVPESEFTQHPDKIAFLRVADWLEGAGLDNDPEAREFYANAIREKVEKEFA